MEERLQKLLSAAGVCSRRAAETYLTAGRVTVNGETAQLGQRADPDRDEILVDGRPLALRGEPVYILLNKPRGYVTTLADERGRKTVAELVADCGQRVYPVGRLDLDSEGLLLLTNDGEWAQHLLHPKHEVEKTYHVSVFGPVAGAAARLAAVTDLEGEPIRPARVEVLRQTAKTAVLAVTIHEGKNRQVRRMCARCGLTVKRLRRVREGALELGNLQPGKWRYLTESEAASLRTEGWISPHSS
ncbi:MAG TPA: rRNA pseudouridine synthase [Candidatus Oscillibacter excrementigallinarum]|uniref:Pseudouridine synthase n=1 Tax=Candidatus Oscillibacter excrementigallinarum TaxID=2838716 RepID=A0A9D2RS94_9FIRM|nr:rRNA pseudouridine synthase [Candidatus Oscillibacter excrementigallinarum]